MASPALAPATSTLTINVFDGTRKLLENGKNILYRIFDGNQKAIPPQELRQSSVRFTGLPFFNNFGDNYRVVVSADKYFQAGYTPVPLSPAHPTELYLMLLPKKNTFNFSNAGWNAVKELFPFIAAGVSESEGKERYSKLMQAKPKTLAALLNICTAMGQIFLPAGTPLSYIKEIIWDDSMKQDRFFAFADVKLMDQVRTAAKEGLFAPEFGSGFFHPGATASWKQVQFGQGDVQLTFHENTTRKIDNTDCVMLEPDIDLYKDLGAHFLLEVLPNKITGGLTNPEAVYVLRWIAGRRSGVPEFNPPYTIVEAQAPSRRK
jgi:hypothetical protein